MKEEQTTENTSLPEQAQPVPANGQPGRWKLVTNTTAQQNKMEPEPFKSGFLRPFSWSHKVEERDLKLGLWLLLIIILVCLGSLPIIPSLLPITTASSLSATPVHSTLPAGQCRASSQELQAIPNPQTFLPPAHLPAAWRQARHTQADFIQAQICAAAFIVAYYSFDSQKTATLTTSTSLLSPGGKQRFYAQGADKNAGLHMVPLQSGSQKRHLQQGAQASIPYLIDAHYVNNTLLAWMVVPYKMAIRGQNQSSSSIVHATVLVIQQPSTVPHQKALWLVSDWRAGTFFFMAPSAL